MLNARVQPASAIDLVQYTSRPAVPVYGVLGVLNVGADVFVGVVTGVEEVAEVDGAVVVRVTDVEFVSLGSDLYDRSSAQPRNPYDDYDTTGPGGMNPSSTQATAFAHPCESFSRLLCSGQFYFSINNTLDLSRTTQYRATTSEPVPDEQFVWNHHMQAPLHPILAAADAIGEVEAPFLVHVIHGYVGKAQVGYRSLTIISRMSTRRAGTRYNTRGIDDSGSVANFVETEMIYSTPTSLLSFVQVRGSVPVFWDQPGLQVVGHKVQITRSREATKPAFERHMSDLSEKYGRVVAVNLVAQDAGGEGVLGMEYRTQFDLAAAAPEARVLHDFDFHAECRGNNYAALGRLVDRVDEDLIRMMCFLADVENNQVVMHQSGVFRVNCVDCLDRTNVVQGLLAEQALKNFVQGLPAQMTDDFKELWANNGDAISRIYAGTGALKSGFTRSGKRTIAGLLDDSVKSVGRFVINNFQDKSRQDTIDTLLGKVKTRKIEVHDPLIESVKQQLYARAHEFTSSRQLYIHIGTYNVNGKLPQEPIDTWLRAPGTGDIAPDIFAIGFQEIVELTAGQIVSADPMKRQMWQQELVTAIRRCYGPDYVLVCDGQLVGAAILIYAKSSLTAHIHSVEMSIVKTGLGGMTGNKGGISISLTVHDTPFCFVTAHFAAGQSAVDDRNRDYAVIASESMFKRGRSIADHDHIVWFGDFNYRVDLDNEAVRSLVAANRFPDLLARDQLHAVRRAGKSFPGFAEGQITFPPTYKYDNGSNTYDTSEKARIPAWCDRILYKSHATSKHAQRAHALMAGSGSDAGGTTPLPAFSPLELIKYARAELLVSDHKPVLALFSVQVAVIDHKRKQAIYQGLFAQRTSRNPFRALMAAEEARKKEAVATATLISLADDESTSPQLPPPSSDTYQWWVEGVAQQQQQPQQPQAPPVAFTGPPMGMGFPSNPWADVSLSRASVPSPPQQSVSGSSNQNNWSLLD
ncbi:Endonuclease/exonuclease/phosphatase [Catenaria anguillulae PL171]|uniref:phosphoinositide 5-phosphatase n=1 Tax=Catenaria anguillulae PL171 TaxID=765915 RepID=A0A1Y2HSG2_9FUNG|nr:Endonuclease/exonuclease/phosphatase [Catenaria anguillulae PL171]